MMPIAEVVNSYRMRLFLVSSIFLVSGLTACGESSTDDANTAKAWRTPQLISFANGNGQSPQIGMDANGNAIVVMFDYQGGYGIFATHYFKNSGLWLSAPVPLMDNVRPSVDIKDWQIAVAPNGNAVSVRRQVDQSNNYHIWATHYNYITRSWSTEAYVQRDVNAPIGTMPRAAIDNSKAVAVWVDGPVNTASIRANTYSSTSGWNATTTEIDDKDMNAGTADFVDIAMASNGEAYVVMQQVDTSGNKSIYFNRYIYISNSWDTASLVDGLTGEADYPKIAIDGNNNAISIWRQVNGSETNLYASYRPEGGNWEAQVAIEALTGGIDIDPVIVMNSSGTAFAAWIQADGTTNSVYANRYTPTGGWETAQLLETGNNIARHVDVAVDSNGNAFAVWSQYSTNDFRIYRNQYTVDSGWDTAELMENSAGKEAYLPKVVFDNSGNAIAVWGLLDPAAGNVSKVWASRYQ
ncbi:MAG TPA: hypothetical protein VIQ03_04415 [Gammaproteobacteria bacterium]